MRVETTGRGGRVINLDEIPMDEFIDHFWNPEPGQHVALVGPNGTGKTTIGIKLLARMCTLYPFLTGVVLVMKPHKGPKSEGRGATGDKTIAMLSKKYGGKVVRNWPMPPRLWGQRRPLFYALWPKLTGRPREDTPMQARMFADALVDLYNEGDSVVFADEAAGLSEDLALDPELKQTLMRGRSLKAAALLASQRPRSVPRAMFSEARHLFLHRMTDEGDYDRLGELAGGHLSRAEIIAVLNKTKRHQWLYLYPEQDIACILV